MAGLNTYLYHHIVGTTVARCHRLWASTIPAQGGKSSNSKLMASMIHATIRPGQAAHVLFSLRYRMTLNVLHMMFDTTPTTTFAAMLYV